MKWHRMLRSIDTVGWSVALVGAGLVGGLVLSIGLVGLPPARQPAVMGPLSLEYLDLIAQRSMSDAAWWMVMVTCISVVAGGASIVLIALTLKEAKRSADAAEISARHAEAAIDVARRMGEAQTRAYMTMSQAVLTIPPAHHPRVKLTLVNSGQTPAKSLSVSFHVRYDERPQQSWESRGNWDHTMFLAELAGGKDDLVECLIPIPLGDQNLSMLSHRRSKMTVEGQIKYRTIFGWSEPTGFRFRTNGDMTTDWSQPYRMQRVADPFSSSQSDRDEMREPDLASSI